MSAVSEYVRSFNVSGELRVLCPVCAHDRKKSHLKENDDLLTSVGFICFKLDDSIYNLFMKNIQNISYYDISNIVMNNIHKFNNVYKLLGYNYTIEEDYDAYFSEYYGLVAYNSKGCSHASNFVITWS